MSDYWQHELRGRTVHTFGVNSNDLGTGTETNNGTRQFVNGTAPVPQQVGFEWHAGNTGGHGGFMNNLGNHSSYDAGHLLARQSGGQGNVNQGVFPQNRDINQGHAGEFDTWRRPEDQFNKQIKAGNEGKWSVTLNDQPRQTYGRHTGLSAADEKMLRDLNAGRPVDYKL